MNNRNVNESKFLKVIKDNNLCISNNPIGIDIDWPKSYAKLYYSEAMNNIYKRNKSPKILEINQNNITKLELWNTFFYNPIIRNIEITKGLPSLYLEDFNDKLKYDLIIINEYKEIYDLLNFISFLKTRLEKDGIILIENIYFSIPIVINLYLFEGANILDFRLKNFILNDCIIEIKKNKSSFKSFFQFIFNCYKLFNFIIIDSIYWTLFKVNIFIKRFR